MEMELLELSVQDVTQPDWNATEFNGGPDNYPSCACAITCLPCYACVLSCSNG
jgi:hypothetical protein